MIIIYLLVFLICMCISLLFTCGIIKLICLCLGLTFFWKYAIGIWLILILLSSFFRRGNHD